VRLPSNKESESCALRVPSERVHGLERPTNHFGHVTVRNSGVAPAHSGPLTASKLGVAPCATAMLLTISTHPWVTRMVTDMVICLFHVLVTLRARKDD